LGKQILVVDDDAEARASVESVLRRQGAETISAASAIEAYELLRLHAPDVVISDLGMPDVDGFEFAKALTAHGSAVRHIPAVALTAYTSECDRSRAMESGFRLHLGKPVEASKLIESIAGLAGHG
jgi:CheY-like chemotaxis protein